MLKKNLVIGFVGRHLKTLPKFVFLFLLSLNLLSCRSDLGGQGNYKQKVDDIKKSETDDRSYRFLELSNGLKVVLVSDLGADKSAASMTVYRGSYQDPVGREGLAHFLEHMLFIGTEKYPEPDGYLQFVRANGGSSNAYTASDHTNYFFDIGSHAFREGFDRFAQFFIAPLFSRDYVEREKNAVNAEYQMQFKDDGWRSNSVTKVALNPDHPQTRFNIGNLKTLSGDVHRDLLVFFEENYSSNQMGLAILTNQTLDEMESWIVEIVSEIRNRNLSSVEIDEPLFKSGTLPATLRHDNIKNIRRISYGFPLPSAKEKHRTKPLDYISNLIGHEGEGSLHEILVKKGWIESLFAGSVDYDETTSLLIVSVDLTKDGYSRIPSINRHLFDYLQMINLKEAERWRYEEQSTMAEISFRFAEKMPAISSVQMLAPRLNDHPPELILSSPYLMKEFDKEMIDKYLAALTPENVLVSISSPEFQGKEKEKNFSVSFELDRNPIELDPIDPEFEELPKKNPFIPSALNLLESDQGPPELFLEKDGIKVYLDTDVDFRIPKVVAQMKIKTDQGFLSAYDQANANLYAMIVKDALNSMSYPAYLAGLTYEIETVAQGFKVLLQGYSEKQFVLIERVLAKLASTKVDLKRFDALKEELLNELANKKFDKPYQQAGRRLKEELISSVWPVEAVFDALVDIELDDLLNWRSDKLANVSLEALFVGNIDSVQVSQIIEHYETVFNSTKKSKDEPEISELSGAREIKLVLDHDDAALFLYVQAEDDDLTNRAKTYLLHHLISPGFFSSLRTDQQLGYVVAAVNSTIKQRGGLGFIIQSPVAGPSYLRSRITDYLKEENARLAALDDKEFTENKAGLISKLMQQDKNLGQRAARYWSDLEMDLETFDGREQLGSAISDLTKEDVLNFFDVIREKTESEYLLISSDGKFGTGKPENF